MIPTLYTHAAAALLAAAVAGAGAWTVQGWRWDAKYQTLAAQYTQAQIDSQEAKRKAEDAFNTRYQQALNDARKREADLRRARNAARAESDGLRSALSEANRQLATAPADAVADYAATVNGLFYQCVEEYQGMAAAASGHAHDARTLSEAWPR